VFEFVCASVNYVCICVRMMACACDHARVIMCVYVLPWSFM